MPKIRCQMGGEITLLVNKRTVNDILLFDEEVKCGDYLDLTIIDNGHGFDEQIITKAFEPFFTTKSTHQGSGLGLSMVFGFIKQSQGYIRIDNRDSGGAKISLLLPLLTYQEKVFQLEPDKPHH